MGSKWSQWKADVGQRLRAARETLGMDQGATAEVLGVAANMVSMIESGERGLNPEMAVKLKKKHGITLDYLYADDPSGLAKSLHDKLMKPKPVAAGGRKQHVA